VFHPETEYLEDLRTLERYIKLELNVQSVMLSSDEILCGVRYRASADWPTLGRKLRKDLGRVRAGLQLVTSEEVKHYSDSGKLTVDGIELVAGDLLVTRYVELPPGGTEVSNSDNEAVVILDVHVYPELQGEWFARELINRVQRLRKKADLQSTDEVSVYYTLTGGPSEPLQNAVHNHAEMLSKALRTVPQAAMDGGIAGKILIVEEQEISDTKFTLTIALC